MNGFHATHAGKNTVNEPVSRRNFLKASSAVASSSLVSSSSQAEMQLARPANPPAGFSDRLSLRFEVNGKQVAVELEPRVTLLDYLRERAGLTGTKKGCNEGACGVCTVLLDGKRVNACLTLAASCDGARITTVEGLASANGTLHPVQAAFIEHDAFQCGYCTPGQVVSAVACIHEGHASDAATVHEWMSGNLCRCAAYPQIAAAVLDAAKKGERA